MADIARTTQRPAFGVPDVRRVQNPQSQSGHRHGLFPGISDGKNVAWEKVAYRGNYRALHTNSPMTIARAMFFKC